MWKLQSQTSKHDCLVRFVTEMEMYGAKMRMLMHGAKVSVCKGGYVEELEGGELPQGGGYTAVKVTSVTPSQY